MPTPCLRYTMGQQDASDRLIGMNLLSPQWVRTETVADQSNPSICCPCELSSVSFRAGPRWRIRWRYGTSATHGIESVNRRPPGR